MTCKGGGGPSTNPKRVVNSVSNISSFQILQALPFGVTLLGSAWTDEYLWGLAAEFAKKTGLGNGPIGHGVTVA